MYASNTNGGDGLASSHLDQLTLFTSVSSIKPCSPYVRMPPLVLSTLLLCRCRDDSLSDFGESRNLKARGMVLLLLPPPVEVAEGGAAAALTMALFAVLVGVVGLVMVLLLLLGGSTAMGGDFGPRPPESLPENELFSVAVSSADALLDSGHIL